MQLTPAMLDFNLHWEEMGRLSLGCTIHALLHISADPLTAGDICGLLDLARSNVSNWLKELQSLGFAQSTRKLGDRRDHFHSIRDMFELVNAVIESRRAREYAPTLEALHKMQEKAENDSTPEPVNQRIKESLTTVQVFDDWYEEVKSLPRSVQLAAIKMGARP